jgi:hypothetical protein
MTIKGYPDGPWDQMPEGYPDDREGLRRAIAERRINMADYKLRQGLALQISDVQAMRDAIEFLDLARKALRSET